MTTPQQHATEALQQWQELRNAGLTPDERIERLITDFFNRTIDSDIRYQDQLNAVAAEMSRA